MKEFTLPLSRHEQALLQDIGQHLNAEPDDWNLLKQELIAIIQSNVTLNQLYQYHKVKLDALGAQIPRQLLPSLAQLKKEIFGETKKIITFDGQSKGQPEDKFKQVINITSPILLTENQDQTTKQLVFLEQISEYVQNYRYFNTYFTGANDQALILPTEPLIYRQVYLLYIDISPEPKGIDNSPTVLHLPQLTYSLTSS